MNIRISFLIINLLIGTLSFAQSPKENPGQSNGPKGSGTLSGIVVDELSQHTLEYANVVVYKSIDSSLVTGTVSDENGIFKIDDIPFGMYYVKLKFLGYLEKTIDAVKVSPENASVDLGEIKLSPASTNIAGVEVVAKQSPILYKLDKKVITVSSNLNNSGGTAIEVLENTPSVQVDIEGNVSLRGSSNFTVLVDGRPSPFTGSDALEQIPAGNIEKIEIITNPSAKYDPDGTAGIINVITKKRSLEGSSGMVNVSGDTNGSFGADFILSLKKEKVSYSLGANFNNRARNGYMESDEWTRFGDTTLYKQSKGDRNGSHGGSALNAGMDYTINARNNLILNVSAGDRSFNRSALSDYREWTNPQTIEINQISDDYMDHNSSFYNANLDFNHNFDTEGHNLKASAFFQTDNSYSENGTDQFNINEIITKGLKSYEDGSGIETRFNLDYTLPFSEFSKFEAGYQTRIDDESEKYGVYNRVMPEGIFSTEDTGKTVSNYTRLIHAAYAIYGNEWKGFGYQFGIRGEYTKRTIENTAASKTYTIDRLDYFPSAHFSYQLPADQQIMTSYSRRIERPRNYYLEPFITYRDAYTLWQGNPGLKPEYINSFELSYKKQFGQSFASLEAFYRNTKNKMERILSVYPEDPGIMLQTVANVGEDFAKGLELMLNINVNKWYNFNLMGSAFDYSYKITSDLLTSQDPGHSTNWDVRLKNTFKIRKNIKFQLDGSYEGPSVTAQGTREGYPMTSSAIRADFWDNKLSVTLQFKDMFGTGRHAHISEGPDFYSKSTFDRNPQVLQLSLSYKINNYREKKNGMGNGGGYEGGGEDF
ncbi:MAG: TonB-dependent receptor [Bacteroidales bacterium]|nr:TonB-dependent receptor [Bacteroidales bacterium]MCF8458518.1 TonB-dependent receptor [Bacteroidales bacterium]